MSTRILTGDCRTVLADLPAGSVQCCVTSPPYYGLRDYGHDGQIGLEQTPDAYVAELVTVFREVRRVLSDTGVVFLNLGDSYAGGKQGRADTNDDSLRKGRQSAGEVKQRPVPPGYKPKDLLMIPARVAIALQADGWWLRSDIIWSKPNPMPESCGDRPTSAHEHVFLLSKRSSYFYDADAIAEGVAPDSLARNGRHVSVGQVPDRADGGGFCGTPVSGVRNIRNVWTIASQPYAGAHFATMPPALVERCIKAGTSEKGQCPHCAAPWVRLTETEYKHHEKWFGDKQGARNSRGTAGTSYNEPISKRTTGWAPSCTCPEHQPVPQTVLDPFGGAGTTALVADQLGRNAVLIELNPAYAALARDRIHGDCPMFASVAAE